MSSTSSTATIPYTSSTPSIPEFPTLPSSPSTASNTTSASFKFPAKWTCPHCDHRQQILTRHGNNPFGHVICEACSKPPSITPHHPKELIHLLGLEALPGREYKISLPPSSLAPPRTKFVWICCACGTSHRDTPKATKNNPGASETCRPPSQPQALLGRVDSLYKSLGKDAKRLPLPDVMSTERKVYRQVFNHKCTRVCKHRACESCYRGVWKVEKEWLVRVYNEEDLERCKFEYSVSKCGWGYG